MIKLWYLIWGEALKDQEASGPFNECQLFRWYSNLTNDHFLITYFGNK